MIRQPDVERGRHAVSRAIAAPTVNASHPAIECRGDGIDSRIDSIFRPHVDAVVAQLQVNEIGLIDALNSFAQSPRQVAFQLVERSLGRRVVCGERCAIKDAGGERSGEVLP
jgi:hypothetical protein